MPKLGDFMTKEYQLPVPHILQDDCYSDTNEKCGAACVQMVLHDIDPTRPSTSQGGKTEQDNLFDQIQIPPPDTTNWHNPPQGINRVLNKQMPDVRRPGREFGTLPANIRAMFDPTLSDQATIYDFLILGNSPVNEPNPGIPRSINVSNQVEQIELLSRLLIRIVAIKGVAPIVAVREDNAHWIVVNGFQVDDDYNDAKLDQRGKIKAMIIRNPLGRYTYRNVNCSELTDSEMEVITGHKCSLNSHVYDVVPYATWVREYLFSDWSETFVVICDWSARVTGKILPKINCYTPEISERSAFSKIVPLAFSKVYRWFVRVFRAICCIFRKCEISAKDAKDRAERAIKDLNLSQLNRRVTPQNILDPVRVKRLDRSDGDYFLVPVGIREGERVRVSAFINISITGEIDDAIVLPFTEKRDTDNAPDGTKEKPTASLAQHPKRDKPTAEQIEHYVALFDQHPKFNDLISEDRSILIGKRIRLADGEVRRIRKVERNATSPYVWRPTPESFSASRPFHNLTLTVADEKGQEKRISFYPPIDDYCLPTENGVFSLPSANYLETVTECIKQKAGNMVGDVLVLVNRRGTTALVMYKSNQTRPISEELNEMRIIINECLNEHSTAGLELDQVRIKAFATNAFLSRWRGGGDLVPIGTSPSP